MLMNNRHLIEAGQEYPALR